jgi:hypothetical protein
MKKCGQGAAWAIFFVCAGLVMLGAGCGGGDDGNSGGTGGSVTNIVTVTNGVTNIVIITNIVADVIHSTGDAVIKGTFHFDFDNGSGGTTAVPAGDTADMKWDRLTAVASQLDPEHGAKFAAMGVVDFGAVTKAQVLTLALSSASISHTALPAGTVVAYRTNAGRIGKFRIEGFSGNQDMAVAWVTWE